MVKDSGAATQAVDPELTVRDPSVSITTSPTV